MCTKKLFFATTKAVVEILVTYTNSAALPSRMKILNNTELSNACANIMKYPVKSPPKLPIPCFQGHPKRDV